MSSELVISANRLPERGAMADFREQFFDTTSQKLNVLQEEYQRMSGALARTADLLKAAADIAEAQEKVVREHLVIQGLGQGNGD